LKRTIETLLFYKCIADALTISCSLQMLLFIHEYGLKGQYNSAQGKVSGGTIRNVALGKWETMKTVRGNTIITARNFFRTPASRTQGVAIHYS